MIKIRSAGIIPFRIQDDQIEYLLIQHKGGHWDVPKGKIEDGETPRDAALRELQEETGLTAEIIEGFSGHTAYGYRDSEGNEVDKTVEFFLGKAESGEVTLSHEHVDFAWLPNEQALERLTYENSRMVLREAHVVANQKG